jgi:hypothetical protein
MPAVKRAATAPPDEAGSISKRKKRKNSSRRQRRQQQEQEKENRTIDDIIEQVGSQSSAGGAGDGDNDENNINAADDNKSEMELLGMSLEHEATTACNNMHAAIAKLTTIMMQQRRQAEEMDKKLNIILSALQNLSSNFTAKHSAANTASHLAGVGVSSASTPRPAAAITDHTARESVVAAVYVDNQLRANRMTNFVVTGLPPTTDRSDQQVVVELLSREFHEVADIVHSKRLGKATPGRIQPLLVVLKTAAQAQRVVSAAKQLRLSTDQVTKDRVFIAANLTKAEARAAYELRCQRRQAADKRRTQQQTTSPEFSQPLQQHQQQHTVAVSSVSVTTTGSSCQTSASQHPSTQPPGDNTVDRISTQPQYQSLSSLPSQPLTVNRRSLPVTDNQQLHPHLQYRWTPLSEQQQQLHTSRPVPVQLTTAGVQSTACGPLMLPQHWPQLQQQSALNVVPSYDQQTSQHDQTWLQSNALYINDSIPTSITDTNNSATQWLQTQPQPQPQLWEQQYHPSMSQPHYSAGVTSSLQLSQPVAGPSCK